MFPDEFRTEIPPDYRGLWEPTPRLLRARWSRQADVSVHILIEAIVPRASGVHEESWNDA